jgi:hypothetical protein
MTHDRYGDHRIADDEAGIARPLLVAASRRLNMQRASRPPRSLWLLLSAFAE